MFTELKTTQCKNRNLKLKAQVQDSSLKPKLNTQVHDWSSVLKGKDQGKGAGTSNKLKYQGQDQNSWHKHRAQVQFSG